MLVSEANIHASFLQLRVRKCVKVHKNLIIIEHFEDKSYEFQLQILCYSKLVLYYIVLYQIYIIF